MVTDEMVNRFLQWPVPADVYPDGIAGQPDRSGTNLLTAIQARAMLEHVLADARPSLATPDGGISDEYVKTICNRYWYPGKKDSFEDMRALVREVWNTARAQPSATAPEHAEDQDFSGFGEAMALTEQAVRSSIRQSLPNDELIASLREAAFKAALPDHRYLMQQAVAALSAILATEKGLTPTGQHIADCERDANRYRWLRLSTNMMDGAMNIHSKKNGFLLAGEELDAALDYAIRRSDDSSDGRKA